MKAICIEDKVLKNGKKEKIPGLTKGKFYTILPSPCFGLEEMFGFFYVKNNKGENKFYSIKLFAFLS